MLCCVGWVACFSGVLAPSTSLATSEGGLALRGLTATDPYVACSAAFCSGVLSRSSWCFAFSSADGDNRTIFIVRVAVAAGGAAAAPAVVSVAVEGGGLVVECGTSDDVVTSVDPHLLES